MTLPINSRFSSQAGIAIGPILFVVAILAILATAIAAGSGTFASNSAAEATKTNAGALLQIGDGLKMGVDRVIGLGTSLNNIVINDGNVSNKEDIFSQAGGGLVPPSTALADTPATDSWIYTWGAVTNIGRPTWLERLAFLKVKIEVCDQINKLGANYTGTIAGTNAATSTSTPSAAVSAALGNFNNTTNLSSAWPTAMDGRMVGCVYNTDTTSHYFFQVLGVQ